jgi:hypothetical protein
MICVLDNGNGSRDMSVRKKASAMADLRTSEGGFEARCEHCGRWRPKLNCGSCPATPFSSTMKRCSPVAAFSRVARLTVEKDELDFH